MYVNVNLGLSLTFVLTLTSLECVWSASSPLFRLANERSALGRREEGIPLVRRARHARRHMPPCVFLSQISDIKTRFEQWMDKNQDGRANFPEVKAFLQTLKPDVTNEVVNSFIGRRDQNDNGQIDLIPEYVQEIVGNDYGDEAAREWFYLHDVDSDGFVTKPELVQVGMAVGMSQNQAENTAAGYYLPLDGDGDGQLNFAEFSQLYQEPTMPSV